MQIQLDIIVNKHTTVVICFKFSNFAYANTVAALTKAAPTALLFALNLVTLLMQIQFYHSQVNPLNGCYLL